MKNDNKNTLVFENDALASGFTQIPNYIQHNNKISLQARFLYSVLLSFAWKENRAFPGQKKLASIMGFSRDDQVRKYLIELKNNNLIVWKRRGLGKTNVYTLLNWDFYLQSQNPTTVGIKNPSGDGIKNTKQKNTKFFTSTKYNYPPGGKVSQREKSQNSPDNGGVAPEPPSSKRKADHKNKEDSSSSPPTHDVVWLSQLKRLSPKMTKNITMFRIDGEKYDFDLNSPLSDSEVYDLVKALVLYYLEKYAVEVGKPHPRYKVSQLEQCLLNLIFVVMLKTADGVPGDKLFEAIDRWFATTAKDENNLRLSHFTGGDDNLIFENCIDKVSNVP